MKNTWRFSGNELVYLQEVLGSGLASGTSGNLNHRFERAFADKVGAKWAVTFNSGTGTLQAALHAVGVGYGDEVILPALTVVSNLYVVLAQNAVPVFADIDEGSFNIDPADIERRITPRTKAIQVVPLYGNPCDYDRIIALANRHGLVVINDAAQAFGANYQGRRIAETCPITSYSLESTKHITTGDGGIVVSNVEEYAVKMRKFGSLGYAALSSGDGRVRLHKDIFQDPGYKRHDAMGYNFRMPEVAAALGLAQVERLEFFVKIRAEIAGLYAEAAREADYLIPQATLAGCTNSYWCYAVRYEHPEVPWQEFRRKYLAFGGDGIYAAWAVGYRETFMENGAWKQLCPPLYRNLSHPPGLCPVAEKVQPRIMQFVNNYGSRAEAEPKIDALRRTIRYFA